MDQNPVPLILGFPGAFFTALYMIIEGVHPEIEVTDEFFNKLFRPDLLDPDQPWTWNDHGEWSLSLGSKTGILRISRDDVERVYQVMEYVWERNTRKARWPD